MDNIEYKGMNITIQRDDNPDNPRNWDNFGKMVYSHRRYVLGDEYMESWQIVEITKNPNILYLPLYVYDHSGIIMGTAPFSCPWDSGQVGIIYVNRDDVLKEFGGKILTKTKKQKALKILQAEVETFNQYISGDIWGYTLETSDGEYLDSCWGYYGYDYCLQEARSIADYYAGEKAKQEAITKMENYFDNRPEVLKTKDRLSIGL